MRTIEDCMLTSRVSDYPTISNGKTRIPGVNDGEEFELTDVSRPYSRVKLTLYIARSPSIWGGPVSM